ncbi:YggS family pyridoxal phosphate-dependent enzyme [Acetivibrio mesophilus]|uniref:Pyridoxal phosphate homeostasis protein n=1 Tax=Acetivibrio mesophilus TaxID=2487273 RepID=A0A4Q0I2H5_9FIRM|nr:YggS family pyridoxal phosphate-dependent enzyme [Acetivibrio mesophilus]ODM25360.1 YggS family pyridoxal phosphate enzyme [Clostridium sp. Bc-iso-3]RXE58440.1 YggS family pyridoxal phosphate-dependent enzyme [Acetivibrio mesophilus]
MIGELDYIKRNLYSVMERIEKAASKSGRSAKDIKLVAVTKTVEPDRILKILDEGIVDLGENRVQELTKKYDILNRECKWHLIGHLQTNKVKYIVDKVSLIHSVDRIELAKEIQKKAEAIGKTIDVLVQVNVSGEESKFGICVQEAYGLVREINSMANVRVKGLMTMAPYAENPEGIRYVFSRLRDLSIDINKEKLDNSSMDILSMGMSNDFEVAIEEGANVVRIGTALFGRRS